MEKPKQIFGQPNKNKLGQIKLKSSHTAKEIINKKKDNWNGINICK